MADEEPKPLTYIPETVLKKRKSNEEWAIKKRERLEERKQRIKEDRKLIFKRAEQYIKEFRDKVIILIFGKASTPFGCALLMKDSFDFNVCHNVICKFV